MVEVSRVDSEVGERRIMKERGWWMGVYVILAWYRLIVIGRVSVKGASLRELRIVTVQIGVFWSYVRVLHRITALCEN